MGFEEFKPEEPLGENLSKETKKVSKKKTSFFRDAVSITALGATLIGGELKAENTKATSPDTKEPMAQEGNKLTDSESLQKVREQLGIKGVKVESDLEEGHVWSPEDAKVFQVLQEQAFFNESAEKKTGEIVNAEKEFRKKHSIKEEKLAENLDDQITSSSGWALNVVRHAKALQESVRDKDDAMRLIDKANSAFIIRYQNPDPEKGDHLTQKAQGKNKFTEWDRAGTRADFIAISQAADSLAEIFRDVAKGQGIHEINIKTETDMLTEISRICKNRVEEQLKEEHSKKFKF